MADRKPRRDTKQWPAIETHLATVCRGIRETAGLTQADIAKELFGGDGKDRKSYISGFETGQSWPNDAEPLIAVYARLAGLGALDLWAAALERTYEEQGQVPARTSLDRALTHLRGEAFLRQRGVSESARAHLRNER